MNCNNFGDPLLAEQVRKEEYCERGNLIQWKEDDTAILKDLVSSITFNHQLLSAEHSRI